jgi:hypothetical protein
MVRTTKGGVAPKKSATKAAPDSPAEEPQTGRLADLDDETWDRIQSMARSQGTTPSEVVRRAIVQTYGEPQTASAVNSGL